MAEVSNILVARCSKLLDADAWLSTQTLWHYFNNLVNILFRWTTVRLNGKQTLCFILLYKARDHR